MQTEIFPKPRSYSQSRSRLSKKGREFIRLHEPHGENLLANLNRFATRWGLQVSYGAIAQEHTLVTLRLKAGFAPEGYGISTSTAGYLITATEECGLFRGLCSLEQVLATGELPYLAIKDAPDFTQRGVMLDISRCKVPSLTTLKALIDQFAALKFNQLQLYTEHTFAFSQHKTVWAEASPLTAAETLELKHYAAARYIELVPNLNCFGHFERWLCHPEYHQYAES
ncbi:MAG: family 20 glycosylhydrolase, partial [Pseudomonadales bacterium]